MSARDRDPIAIAVRASLALAGAIALAFLTVSLGPARDVHRAEHLLDTGRGAEGIVLLRHAADHTRSTRPEVRLGQAYLFARDPARARAVLESVLEREPDNVDAQRALAQANADG